MDSKKSPGGTTLPTSAAEAAPPPPYEIKETRFATLSLHQTDRIRLLQFTPEEVDNIRSLVESAWADGIQAARDYGESSELKLKGTPWAGFKNDKQKPLLRTLFEGLYGMGWILDASISIAKTANAKGKFPRIPIPPPNPNPNQNRTRHIPIPQASARPTTTGARLAGDIIRQIQDPQHPRGAARLHTGAETGVRGMDRRDRELRGRGARRTAAQALVLDQPRRTHDGAAQDDAADRRGAGGVWVRDLREREDGRVG
ncbi:hypothetical protein H2198_001872 [Neophaeococcomyces mojaviensis]|uniref:Uncharacterized protein n=1 Tax=Neophaeococcomyces mojaviensis TaxID=3383035 RepID=A0ACC3AFK2_9EURO|nr:hypothetical protein H2198_001872 [Knufia sp. JES_112]